MGKQQPHKRPWKGDAVMADKSVTFGMLHLKVTAEIWDYVRLSGSHANLIKLAKVSQDKHFWIIVTAESYDRYIQRAS